MDEAPKIRPELSRRSILRNLAVTAGGAAVLGTMMSGNREAAAQTTKLAKTVVAYQDTPHDGQRCDNCLQFEIALLVQGCRGRDCTGRLVQSLREEAGLSWEISERGRGRSNDAVFAQPLYFVAVDTAQLAQ